MGAKTRKDIPMFDTRGASCVNSDPEIFMPEGKDHIQITREAKATCSTCPLVKVCLDYAIDTEQWGIWGGTTMKERKILRRYPHQKNGYIRDLILSGGTKDLAKLEDENAIV